MVEFLGRVKIASERPGHIDALCRYEGVGNSKHEDVFWTPEYVVVGTDVEVWLLRGNCKYLEYAGTLRELTDMTRQSESVGFKDVLWTPKHFESWWGKTCLGTRCEEIKLEILLG
jgi:hypothetical protein